MKPWIGSWNGNPPLNLSSPASGSLTGRWIVYGLLTDAQGCPVAVEVFAGNTADPNTVKGQIGKLRQRFGLARVILVGDRGTPNRASNGSPRCAPHRFKRWPAPAPCRCRCSIGGTWPSSLTKTFPASG